MFAHYANLRDRLQRRYAITILEFGDGFPIYSKYINFGPNYVTIDKMACQFLELSLVRWGDKHSSCLGIVKKRPFKTY